VSACNAFPLERNGVEGRDTRVATELVAPTGRPCETDSHCRYITDVSPSRLVVL
jgi:hypothetical protein